MVPAVALCFEEEVLLDEPLRHHELGSALALALAVGRRVATALAAVAAGARLARRCLASPATGSPVVPTAAPRRSAAPQRRAAAPIRSAATPRRRASRVASRPPSAATSLRHGAARALSYAVCTRALGSLWRGLHAPSPDVSSDGSGGRCARCGLALNEAWPFRADPPLIHR